MSSKYHQFNNNNNNNNDGSDSEPDNDNPNSYLGKSSLDALERQPETALQVQIDRRKKDAVPNSNPFSFGTNIGTNAGMSNLLSLTKKKKKPHVPKIQSSGVVNYGGIGIDQNSDSESESIASTLSSGSIPQGYNLPFHMQAGFGNNNALGTSDHAESDDDEMSQRTPIPKAPPNPAINAILPSDFLRNRTNSETNISDISEDDSIVKRQKREEENVGRLVHAAKQQQSFAQAWFSAGVGQNALPPIPVKKKLPSNAPSSLRSNVKKTQIVDPKEQSSGGPIDLDSGEVWNESDEGEENHSKRNWEIGSFNYGTTHSMPTKKRANKKIIQFGVPEDEDLTTYYIENKCLDRIVCTIGSTRCSFLAVIVVCIFTLLLVGGAVSAGIYLSQQSDEIQPSHMPSSAPSISHQPSISLVPSSTPTEEPTMTPSSVPTSGPSASPSSRPSLRPSAVPTDKPSSEPSSPPSLLPSSSPSKSPTSQPSSQPSISSQPSLQPSSQPSNCFSSVLYEPQGDIQVLSSGYGNDRNGYSISLSADGTIMAVSAILYPESFGSVTVYEKNIINSQVVEWNLKGQLITGQQGFGVNIELSNDGNTLVVGNPTENSGVARVYRFNNNLNDWTKLGQDIVENDSTVAGFAVAISGNGQVVAVGDPDYGSGKGRVKVYEFDSSVQDWVERGPSIDGSSSFGEFGYSVSLSVNGNVVVCGAPRGGTTVWNISGSVRVLWWDPTFSRWNMLGQELESFTEFGPARFGHEISIAEDETKPRIAIASVDSTVMNLDKSGRVSVWEYDANFQFWMQVGDDMVGTPNGNQKFGSSVSIAGDGSHVAVGVPIFAKGSAHVYFWNGGVWDESNTLSGNNYESGFGHSVDLSKDGNTLAVGASSQFWEGYSQVFMSNKDCESE